MRKDETITELQAATEQLHAAAEDFATACEGGAADLLRSGVFQTNPEMDRASARLHASAIHFRTARKKEE